MSTKAQSRLFEEFYSVEEYDRELDKILLIDDPVFAAHLYHAISRVSILLDEQTVSVEAYERLCDYLAERFEELPSVVKETLKLEDLQAGTCTLVELEEGEAFEKGKHFHEPSTVYLEALEDNMLTDFIIESWEDNASTN